MLLIIICGILSKTRPFMQSGPQQLHGTRYVFNTHFDHASQPARTKSAILLARRIADRPRPDPVIVLGDFNADETSEPMHYLLGHVAGSPTRLSDTFREVSQKDGEVGTFHGFQGTRTGRKIDFVLTTRPTKVRDAQIIRDHKDGHYPSDHFPVTAVVEFSPSGSD